MTGLVEAVGNAEEYASREDIDEEAYEIICDLLKVIEFMTLKLSAMIGDRPLP